MAPTSFTQALERAARLAVQALPATLHGRIADAVVLVRDGHCFQTDDGTWSVQSASDPAQTYTHVNGVCPCEDAHFHQPPHGLCKHRLAVYVARKVAQLMQQPAEPAEPVVLPEEMEVFPDNDPGELPMEPPAPPPAPLPEAPCSANVHVTIAGRDVLITLRDRDEGHLLARLHTLLAGYPVPQPAAQPGRGVVQDPRRADAAAHEREGLMAFALY